jgi:hypothetical protein
MSKWMHITGAMRIDAIEHGRAVEELRRELSRPLSGHGIAVVDCTDGIPRHSDDCLKYKVDYIGAMGSHWLTLVCAVVTVWADLENVVSPDAICVWARRVLEMKRSSPRYLVISIDAESDGKWLVILANGKIAMRTISQ